MKYFILVLVMASFLNAENAMVERMQSVVDEVTDLRARYESAILENKACKAKLNEKCQITSSPLDKKQIQDLEFENTKLKQAHEVSKKEIKKIHNLEEEATTLRKENKRLSSSAKILVQKNHSLMLQVKQSKQTKVQTPELISLQNENVKIKKDLTTSQQKLKKLEKELKTSQTQIISLQKSIKTKDKEFLSLQTKTVKPSGKKIQNDLIILQKKSKQLEKDLETSQTQTQALKKTIETKDKELKLVQKKCKAQKVVKKKVKTTSTVCEDDNPFPRLLKKEKTSVKPKPIVKPKIKTQKKSVSGVYRIKGESSIYDESHSHVIEIWEDRRSFTSVKTEGDWIEISGYFVHKKWEKALVSMWVKKNNTIKR